MPKRKSSIHTRCRALNTVIAEGGTVKANIRGQMQILDSIQVGDLGISLLFHDEEKNLVLFAVNPDNPHPLEFIVTLPWEKSNDK